jgi:hypothetical protein
MEAVVNAIEECAGRAQLVTQQAGHPLQKIRRGFSLGDAGLV